MGASNNAQGQNAGARQQINQQTTQALQRLMTYLGQNGSQPPGGAFTPGGGGPPGMPTSGGPGMAGQTPMNPQQIQALMQSLQTSGGPGTVGSGAMATPTPPGPQMGQRFGPNG
jgi:hypothetical protein